MSISLQYHQNDFTYVAKDFQNLPSIIENYCSLKSIDIIVDSFDNIPETDAIQNPELYKDHILAIRLNCISPEQLIINQRNIIDSLQDYSYYLLVEQTAVHYKQAIKELQSLLKQLFDLKIRYSINDILNEDLLLLAYVSNGKSKRPMQTSAFYELVPGHLQHIIYKDFEIRKEIFDSLARVLETNIHVITLGFREDRDVLKLEARNSRILIEFCQLLWDKKLVSKNDKFKLEQLLKESFGIDPNQYSKLQSDIKIKGKEPYRELKKLLDI